MYDERKGVRWKKNERKEFPSPTAQIQNLDHGTENETYHVVFHSFDSEPG
jgi:hypothetical protein